MSMVKGVSRRVIVVDASDRRYFDKAIFILRSDAPTVGKDYSPIMQEACRIASRCAQHRQRPIFSLPAPLWGLIGAGAVAFPWFFLTHEITFL